MQLTRAKSELFSEMRTKCELFDGKSSHADQSSQCELKGHLWLPLGSLHIFSVPYRTVIPDPEALSAPAVL